MTLGAPDSVNAPERAADTAPRGRGLTSVLIVAGAASAVLGATVLWAAAGPAVFLDALLAGIAGCF